MDNRRTQDRRISPAVGEFAVEECARLRALNAELVAALKALTATARTFRNVPKDEQEWTSLDDEALEAAFAALAKGE